MWKILLAVFLILVILLLYSNDFSAQKSMDSVKTRAMDMKDSWSKPSVPSTPAPPAPAAPAPAAPAAKKEGFCPKLMQKYGFCNAGEGLTSNYQRPRGSVFPY
jgi:hypothetical protein